MKKIGKITIRTKKDFNSFNDYNSYKSAIRKLSKMWILPVFVFSLNFFGCLVNAVYSIYCLITLNNMFKSIISIFMTFAMICLTVFAYKMLKQVAVTFSRYERLVFDIIQDTELDTQQHSELNAQIKSVIDNV